MSQRLSLDTGFVLDAWLTRDVWPRRILAFLVDVIAIAILAAAIGWVIVVLGFLTLGLGFLLLHLTPLIPPVYYVLWLQTRGAATPGQRLLGLTVRQDDTLILADPVRPSLAQSIAWTVLLGLSFALSMLPFLVMFATRRRRAAHDLLSGLTVVHATALNRAPAMP
ncbi:RDD family protein [Acidiphilium sp. AL]|uniref:RDD family protein n=1 Tax=Acidiphilium iwatense TaxID=768198 RepID=A0ABS9DXD8_9PROT|nr:MULTISPECIES: RDD family protein [Acidiphilium]MCF3947408.1 RDD family protein [Acidiphilium iwatense]MCU4161705.1 RDD family protein [Acidiphilium sp. AL]